MGLDGADAIKRIVYAARLLFAWALNSIIVYDYRKKFFLSVNRKLLTVNRIQHPISESCNSPACKLFQALFQNTLSKISPGASR